MELNSCSVQQWYFGSKNYFSFSFYVVYRQLFQFLFSFSELFISVFIQFRCNHFYFIQFTKHFSFSSPSNSCQSPCQFCKSVTLAAPSVWKSVSVDKSFFQHSLIEFQTNSHLERHEHSGSSSRMKQPTDRKDAFHIGLRCRCTYQVKAMQLPKDIWHTRTQRH